jgi:hypothetical protein
MLRKNRNVHSSCSPLTGGVDLNRNYGFKWGHDNVGSNPNPCSQSYRGTGPFSEPETQAIKNWFAGNKQFSPRRRMLGNKFDNGYKGLQGGERCISAMNFHSYGDLWIEPYNYIKDKVDKELSRKNHILFEAYQEFNIAAYRPDGAKYGNAAATIDYLANGEASDWMLAVNNVFAFSPELGIKNSDS